MPRRKPPQEPPADSPTSAPKPTTKKARAGGRRAPAPTNKAKPKARSKAPTTTWRRWILLELLTLVAGAAAGLGLAAIVSLGWADDVVARWLTAPPPAQPALLWSGPITLREGQALSLSSLSADLLAAGYDRDDGCAPGVGQRGCFRVGEGSLQLWTRPDTLRDGRAIGGTATVTLKDDRIAEIQPSSRLILRPTLLASLAQDEDHAAPIALDQLSPWIEPALLAAEDDRFRRHWGLDAIGIGRALWVRLTRGETQGGSTLTQQLAKNLFAGPERSLRRKVREAFLALALERALGKERLLELYVREVYLGQVGGQPLRGFEAAARAWFGKSAQQLDLGEAATLVGIIPAPNAYNPSRSLELAQERRDLVLDRMVATGRLSLNDAAKAKAKPLVLQGVLPSKVRRAPYAVAAVLDQVESTLGEGGLDRGGWQIYTAIDVVFQRAAEQAVQEGLATLDQPDAQAALVALRVSDGAVLAWVGGRSFAASPFDRARSAQRSAGSTVKALTLLAALDAGLVNASARLSDQPLVRTFDGTTWRPSNYDGKFLGEVSLRQAIEQSRNIPAVHLAEAVGTDRLRRFLLRAGLTEATALPSVALGAFPTTPVQLASAFTTFPSGGQRSEARLIEAVLNAEGEPILELPAQTSRLAGAEATAIASFLLQGVTERGTGAAVKKWGLVQGVGGKTGTSDGGRDAWFVGFTPEVVVAVWVGLDRGELGATGGQAAVPIWARAVADYGVAGTLPSPKGLVQVELCEDDGLLPCPGCSQTHAELFVRGTEPSQRCGGLGPGLGGLFSRLFDGEGAESAPASTEPEGEKRRRPNKKER